MVVSQKPQVTKFPCPICQDGNGKANYTEFSLERHLLNFHKRVDASDLTDRWVSRLLYEFLISPPDSPASAGTSPFFTIPQQTAGVSCRAPASAGIFVPKECQDDVCDRCLIQIDECPLAWGRGE